MNSALAAEQEIHHVAIFDHVLLAFSAHFSRIFGALLALVSHEIFVGNSLSADIAFFKVGVDHTCSLGACIAYMDGPSTHFFHAGGEISL